MAALFPRWSNSLYRAGWLALLVVLAGIPTCFMIGARTPYLTGQYLVIATPVLAMALLLIAVDHSFGLGVFDPSLGGDPILYQHLFWFYSHPAV